MADRVQVNLRVDGDLLAWVDGRRGGMPRNEFVVWALGHCRALGMSPTPSTAVVASGRAVEGFVGSELPGHADVPGLGWCRPTSAEAKRGVVVDVALLERARR